MNYGEFSRLSRKNYETVLKKMDISELADTKGLIDKVINELEVLKDAPQLQNANYWVDAYLHCKRDDDDYKLVCEGTYTDILADAVMWLMALAEFEKIELETWIRAKIKRNRNRDLKKDGYEKNGFI